MISLVSENLKNGKEPIPNNFLTDTLRFLLRWGLRLILLVVALTALIGIIVFIFQKYDSWKNESVILVALKCGPTSVTLKIFLNFVHLPTGHHEKTK